MQIHAVEPRRGKGCGHFDLPVNALLAQDGNSRRPSADHSGRLRRIKGQPRTQARILISRANKRCKFLICTGRRVASALHRITGSCPLLLQLTSGGCEQNLICLADENLIISAHRTNHSGLHQRSGHEIRKIRGGDLQHDANFLIKQRRQQGGLVGELYVDARARRKRHFEHGGQQSTV